jgi:hypothetical protein
MQPPLRPRTAPFRHALAAAVAGVVLLGGCRGDRTPSAPADFLISAGDSTFWVQSHRSGYRLRASPILLASYDGRFYEVYVTDEDRSFRTAVFVGQRIWRRDILTGDSTVVFEDTVVAGHAARFAAANPDAERLPPDEDMEEDPELSVTGEVSVLDVHGPYLSFEHHLDNEDRGQQPWHSTRHGVIDLRTAREVSAADLVGREQARQLLRAARHAYLSAIDSINTNRSDAGRRVAASLADFSFDERSFSITDVESAFALAFAAPGRGEGTAGAVTLPLSPIAAGDPEWWAHVRRALPDRRAEDADHWRRPGYEVVARYDTGFAELAIVDGRGRERRVGRVPTPIAMIYWLDEPPVARTVRSALSRAFDEAAYYDEAVRTASTRRYVNENGKGREGVAARDLGADDAAGREQPRPRLRGSDPLDDGQGRGDRRLQTLAHQRRDRVDRPRGLPRAHSHG